MLPAKHDFVIKQGSNFSRLIQWVDKDGDPTDLTGLEARMKVKETKDGAQIAEWKTDGATTLVIQSIPLGLILINVPAATTAALDFDRAVYDLELYDASANVYCILEGNITLNKEVTTT